MNESDYTARNWLNLNWSEWITLHPDNDRLTDVTTDEGLYRVHHTERDGLTYIGETGRSLRGRIRALARGTHANEMPYRDPHTAAPTLWAIRDLHGTGFRVSYTAPERAEDKQHRKGLEDSLIAVYRREHDESPTANFGRIINGYKQSNFSYNDNPFHGSKLSDDETEPNNEPGRPPLSWTNSEDVLSPNWMGLNWSEPFHLRDRLEASPPDVGVYRIWYEDEAPPLAYIGESSNLSRRFYSHEGTFGGNALTSFAEPSDIESAHKRDEVETDLIGAHYLSLERSPTEQY
jgi:hypothetical protein